MQEITQEQLEKFVKVVVSIERKYGFELKNVNSKREGEVARWLNKFVTEEFEDDNQQD